MKLGHKGEGTFRQTLYSVINEGTREYQIFSTASSKRKLIARNAHPPPTPIKKGKNRLQFMF